MIAAILHLGAGCPVLHITEPKLLSFAGPVPAPCRASWASLHPRAPKPGKVDWLHCGPKWDREQQKTSTYKPDLTWALREKWGFYVAQDVLYYPSFPSYLGYFNPFSRWQRADSTINLRTGIATSPRARKVYLVKDRVSTLTKMYAYGLSFQHFEVLATLTSASVIMFHLSCNIRLAALIWKRSKRSSVSAEVCGWPPKPVWSFLGVVISHVNLQLF